MPGITYFETADEFRRWLQRHHRHATELVVGFHKKGTKRRSITYPEALDHALCHGWIDGIRRRVDDESYSIRFTPRRATSIWSNVNIRRVGELTKLGLMRPAGIAAFEARTSAKSGVYSFENRTKAVLSAAFEKRFKANKKAWAFFTTQPPGYRAIACYWVMSAKQEATRLKRLATLIDDSAHGLRIKQQRR